MELFNLKCIKCKRDYQDSEPDDYYCPPCNKMRLKIAAEVDKNHKTGESLSKMSDLQRFDSLPKVGRFVNSKYL